LGSISPTFYTQLLPTQILEVQKSLSSHQWLFELLGSVHVKAARKMLVKSTPAVNFINILKAAFTSADPEGTKNSQAVSLFVESC